MAIESERLLAIFEARFSSLEKALTKARSNAQKSFGDIEAAGNRAENVLAKVGSRGTPGIDKMSKSVNALRGQTGNLAAQFNDIGVQLASGQSPFLIAIQQGSQINQVLGQAGARGAVSALGGAFMSMLNPVSLATFAIIGLGGAAVQYFASMLSDGEDANASLKEQASAIQRVADKWEKAFPAVKTYNDELKRQKDDSDIAVAKQATIQHALEATTASIADVYSQMQNLSGSASDMAEFQDQFFRAQVALRQLNDKIRSGTATTEDFNAVIATMAELAGNDAVAANNALADSLAAAGDAAAEAAQKLVLFNNQQAQRNAPKGTEPRHRKTLDEAQAEFDAAKNNGAVDAALRIESAFDEPDKPSKSRRGRRGGGAGSENAYQRQTEQIAKRTASLQAQTSAQASVNPLIDDFGRTLETARAKQDLLTAAQQAGLTITPELTATIDALAGKYGEAYAASQKLAKSQDDARRTAQEFNQTARDTFGTFVSDLVHGKSAAEALSDALSRLGDRLLDLALDDLFGTGKGGGGGGLFGFLFGGGGLLSSIFHKGGVAGGPAPSRAVSPAMFAGAPRYHSGTAGAGLRSDEVPAILQRGEIVLPKNARKIGSSSNAPQPVAITVNVEGANGDQHVINLVQEGVRTGLSRYDKNLPNRINQFNERGI